MGSVMKHNKIVVAALAVCAAFGASAAFDADYLRPVRPIGVVPVDASNAKLIKTYLALYRAEKNPLDLAKARALGDALVRIQRPNDYIPTEYAKVEKREDSMQGWLNCTCFALSALAELAEFSGE